MAGGPPTGDSPHQYAACGVGTAVSAAAAAGLNILRLRVADRDIGRRSETEIHLYRYFRAREAYRIPRRPQFHYTPQAQWMNDPNGRFTMR